jgi:glycogen debranching enzyme GlgX/4-alpha-glucanotransferase
MRRVGPGSPEPLGVTPDASGVNVAVASAQASAIDLCLFDDDDREIERIRLPERSGDVLHAHVEGIRAGQRYGLRAHGPYDPANGQRFNAAKLLLDPQAELLDRPFVMHPSMFGYRRGDPAADLSFDPTDSGPFMPKGVVIQHAAPETGARPVLPWGRTVVYEMHVRGFTKRHPDVPEAARGTFAGLAHPAALDHLVRLGVSAVEIMPAAAWVDERHLVPLGLTNYWGYNPVGFRAPDPRLAPGGWEEIRRTVDALHAAGIAVILDVVLNHAGEGDELGPTLSLRGLDNAGYYRLRPEEPRRYIDDTGTGNTLALDRAPALRLVMDALRSWAVRAGLDGFRFDLATTLGRRPDGFDPAAPLIAAIGQDPALRGLKLIAEPWDCGPGGHQTGRFPPLWGEWNDRFRDDVRRFWRGDRDMTGALATRLAGSSDHFASKRRPSRGVNFVVAHDGFTLVDLVSYERKRNDANGEGNRDGTDGNLSWNSGAEGASTDPVIAAARLADQRALLATLIFARGTPMLVMGSECGQSQGGNNNAYPQDNAISWLDWAGADRDLAAFTARLIALREARPALHADAFLTGRPIDGGELRDVVWRGPDGRELSGDTWSTSAADTLLVDFGAAASEAGPADRALLVLHRGRKPAGIRLPAPRDGHAWRLELDSANPVQGPRLVEAPELAVGPRSVAVLAETVEPRPDRLSRGASDAEIQRLARTVGIAPDWWDIDGVHHPVPLDSTRAILRAFGLPCATGTDIVDAMRALEGRSASFPQVVLGRPGEPLALTCAGPPGPVEGRLHVEGDAVRPVILLRQPAGRDGAQRIELPPLATGEHRLEIDGAGACDIVIAPHRAHIPDRLRSGRAFGLAAHLYSLRRRRDQGVGDFTALAALAEAAGAEGVATIGLNPLHALFAGDPERASPYHPSDRRFLDPTYLDLDRVAALIQGPRLHEVLGSQQPLFAALRERPSVDYAAVGAAKQEALSAAAQDLAALPSAHALSREFDDFVKSRGVALRDFALFEALATHHPHEPWQRWPEGLRRPGTAGTRAFADAHPADLRASMVRQFLCDRQFGEAADRARAAGLWLGFYRDLAVGAAPDGAEIWSQPDLFAPGLSVGAPPDPFSRSGQVWSLPPPNPLEVERTGARSFAGLLAANMRHAGALRIDHAMGLTRLFLVPDGATGADGAYVAYPLDWMLARLTLESRRAGCLVVGEDLGTVPDGFRERLTAADVLSYRVLWFERDGDAFRPPSSYPAASVACVSTHDLPTLSGWWTGADIAERQELGLLDEAAGAGARRARAAERTALLALLRAEDLDPGPVDEAAPPSDRLIAAIHALVGMTPSTLVLAQADDLAREASAVNLPGTDRERPNWRRRLRPDVQELLRSPLAHEVLATLRAQRG